jgi:hypothetical protein
MSDRQEDCMPLDPNLLNRAKTAGSQLADAERAALLARADYHTAIRRLHLAGASLREIADALSLSHQRVQQVVMAAGGSWWQVWRRRTKERDAVCSWCERSPSEVSKLIAGPKVYICDSCVDAAERAVRGTVTGPSNISVVGGTSRQRCSFCRKRGTESRSLVIGPANVCTECLVVCRDILDSRAA